MGTAIHCRKIALITAIKINITLGKLFLMVKSLNPFVYQEISHTKNIRIEMQYQRKGSD